MNPGQPSARRHLVAIAQLPFMVTVVVPIGLLFLERNRASERWLPLWISAVAAGVLLALGLTLFVSTLRLFGTQGAGTLAPWDPTTRLVVAGPYRYVRNPMITGVFAVLLAEAVLFSSPALMLWFFGFVIGNVVYMRLSEEPGLRQRFGPAYDTYADNVPAWIPRTTPWDPPAGTD